MGIYLLRRFVALIPVLIIVGTIIFFIMHLMPGNPASLMLGPEATDEQITALSEKMGLDRPVLIQFFEWFKNILRGDFGNSLFFQGMPVTRVVYEHFQATLFLTLTGLSFAVIFGIVFGVLSAAFHDRLPDRILMVITSIGVAIPNFWLGLMLALVFAILFPILPPAGYKPLSAGIWTSFRYLILPAVALAFGQASLIARMTRANMLESLQNDYIRTARAKGLPEGIVVFKHALKNALIPTITVIGLSFANLMGGAVVTEQIFNIPGIGRLLIKSVFTRDYPVIEGIVLYIAGAWVLVNLLVDVAYSFFDPRIKY
ncbi:MAG: ABC transporter permease [Deltaproteobacteria bacterium]|nr:ABC transporter permease [Deltaproteobacteria bacterium]